MMIRFGVALAAALLLCGCTGAPVPKLAKCTGPYRYANTYGTVLPSLPVPGQAPSAATPPAPAQPPSGAAPTPPADTGPHASEIVPGQTAPKKIGAIQPHYPSC